MKRDWLKKNYPIGVGLDDIIREYVNYRCSETNLGDRENKLRIAELSTLLSYIFKFENTPVFPEKFDGTFTM